MTFPADYATSRARFLAAARARGWECHGYLTGENDPNGAPLSIDVAISPAPAGSDRALVVSSGLHGVEGPFGAAVQLALLETAVGGIPWPPARTRCVFIHALNPYGYAWSRRVDASNVDLNRAFRWDGMGTLGGAEAYAAFDSLLNPERPPARFDGFRARLLWAAAANGPAALRRAIAVGQRGFPRGLFFAGQTTTHLQDLLEAHLPVWLAGAAKIVHLDLHTGLGRWAGHKLIVDYPLSRPGREWMTTAFGEGAVVESARDAGAYTAQGSFGQWCVARDLAPDYLFAFMEFGTYGNLKVVEGLRAENQAVQWSRPGDPRIEAAKARLRELFCPASLSWRSRVIGAAVPRVLQAATGLSQMKL